MTGLEKVEERLIEDYRLCCDRKFRLVKERIQLVQEKDGLSSKIAKIDTESKTEDEEMIAITNILVFINAEIIKERELLNSEPLNQEEKEFWTDSHNYFELVKRHKKRTGKSLKDAKETVDEYKKSLEV